MIARIGGLVYSGKACMRFGCIPAHNIYNGTLATC